MKNTFMPLWARPKITKRIGIFCISQNDKNPTKTFGAFPVSLAIFLTTFPSEMYFKLKYYTYLMFYVYLIRVIIRRRFIYILYIHYN